MILLLIFIIILSTAIGIWLKHTTEKRANERSNRLQQKQEQLLASLKEKL